MRKAAIITGYTCNNNCRFCYDAAKRRQGIKDLSTDDIKSRLVKARDGGCGYVDFLGGEFTIRKDALELVAFARRLGFETISITTNGRMFSYRETAKSFIDAGTNSVIFSVHGHTAKLHDSQTMVEGSFSQLMKGIENIRALGLPLFTNTTITKLNYREFPKIAQFLVNLGSVNSEFIFVDPAGMEDDDFCETVPRISDAAPYIRKGLDIGIRNGIGHWHIRYVPLCHFQGYEDNVSELEETFRNEEHYGPEFTNLDVESSRKAVARVKGLQCVSCDSISSCEGVWKMYAEKYGLSELKPVEILPEEVKVEITRKCNLDCDFCFNKNHQGSPSGTDISKKDLSKLFSDMRKSGMKAVRITGGEPFLRDDLYDLVKEAKYRGLYVILNTNGLLVGKKNSMVFDHVDDVLLSFHDFENMEEKAGLLKRLRGFGLVRRCCTVATKKNIKNMESFYEFFEKNPVDDWFLLRPVPTPENKNPISNGDVKELIEKIHSLNEKYKTKTKVSNALPFCSYEPEKVSAVCVGGRNDDGRTRIVVDAKGRIKPSYFSNRILGNIRKDSVHDSWQSDYMKRVRKLEIAPEQCRECGYFKKCMGGLLFAAKFSKGSETGMDPLASPSVFLS